MKKEEKRPSKSTVSSGIAIALTAFLLSIFLYFQPQYLGSLTNVAQIILIFIGFAGLGIELEKVINGNRELLAQQAKVSGLFNNIGIGMALLILWASLYNQSPIAWLNGLTFIILMFATYGITLGLVNLLFAALPQTGIVGSVPTTPSSSSQNETRRPWSLALKIAVVISGLTAFLASLLQILQILKVIQ